MQHMLYLTHTKYITIFYSMKMYIYFLAYEVSTARSQLLFCRYFFIKVIHCSFLHICIYYNNIFFHISFRLKCILQLMDALWLLFHFLTLPPPRKELFNNIKYVAVVYLSVLCIWVSEHVCVHICLFCMSHNVVKIFLVF